MSRLHTELGQEQDVPDLAQHRRQIHRSAHVQHQKELFVFLLQAEDVADFRIGQGDVPRDILPVISFPRSPGKHVHGGHTASFQGQIVFRLRHDRPHALDDGVGMVSSRPGPDLADEVFFCLRAHRVIGVQPARGGQAEARGLQAILHGDKIAGVYLARSRAALHRPPSSAPEERKIPGLGEGEASVRLQQHRALRERRAKHLDMFPFVILQLAAESIEIRRLFHVCLRCRQRYFSSIGVCWPS